MHSRQWKRREFITLLGGAAAAWPLAARAQRSGKTYRIGFWGGRCCAANPTIGLITATNKLFESDWEIGFFPVTAFTEGDAAIDVTPPACILKLHRSLGRRSKGDNKMKKPQNTPRATLRHAPATTGRDGAIDFAAKVEASSAERLMLEMPPGELKSIDAWIKTQPAPRPSRPDAIRRLVEQALAGAQRPQKRSKEAASKAHQMAGQELDRLADASLSADERERRKRRLTKGPREFRDMRGDLPKPKG